MGKSIEEASDLMKTDLTQLQMSSQVKPVELKRLENMKKRGKSGAALTWDVDIEEVSERPSDSRQALHIASLLESKNIPNNVLSQTAFPNCSDDTNTNSRGKLDVTIFRLSNFSLINEEDLQV